MPDFTKYLHTMQVPFSPIPVGPYGPIVTRAKWPYWTRAVLGPFFSLTNQSNLSPNNPSPLANHSRSSQSFLVSSRP